jgi:hypothetical protein
VAYSSTFDTSTQGSIIGWIRYNEPVQFSELFDGEPQYYAGSIVQVQEVLTIFLKITDEALIDRDLLWYDPKLYLGTYQLIDPDGITGHADGDDGYLVSTVQKIKRYSWYTITANPGVPVGKMANNPIDDCNFYIQPEAYVFPGDELPVPGFRLHPLELNQPVFRMTSTIARAPLNDTSFNARIYGIGLYLRPGVEGIRLDYKAQIINDIYTDYPPIEPQICLVAKPDPCAAEYQAYIGTSPSSRGYYKDLGECEVQKASRSPVPGIEFRCIPRVWVCSTDPDYTKQGYQIGNFPTG